LLLRAALAENAALVVRGRISAGARALAEVKPLRWSFLLSLPLLVAAMWTAFVALARVERGQLVAELADRASHGGDQEAALAVRQLAKMPRPPLESLVTAATSPSRPVADEAQLAINDLLRRWQRQLKSGKVRPVQKQLDALAESLDRHSVSFTPRDYAWLARTAEKIIQLANRASPTGNAALAVHCDALLAITNQTRIAARHSARPSAATDATAEATDTAVPLPPAPMPESVFSPLPTSALDSLLPTDAAANRNTAPFRSPLSPGAATIDWQPRWSPPTAMTPPVNSRPLIFRPRDAADTVIGRPLVTAEPPAVPSPISSFESLDTRTLLQRWSTEKGAGVAELERELARRGFARLSPALVEALLSDVAAERERLVYTLLDTPGIDAHAWLLLLADDSDAGVRVAAVSMMATSNDPVLVEKALQIALHDRDPQVASLAERLRNRRVGAGRR
jgi:hypothetical protein